MNPLDQLEMAEDLEFEQIRDKVNDGLADDFVNVEIRTIAKYATYRLLDELEDIERLIKAGDNFQRVIDMKILDAVAKLKVSPERRDEED